MASNVGTVDTGEVLSKTTLTLTLNTRRATSVRLLIGSTIIRLGSWIMGYGGVRIVDPPEVRNCCCDD